jgi:hypothetical protein
VNPGAEGSLNGWTIAGDGRAETSRSHRAPHSGDCFFTGSPVEDVNNRISSGAQVIDLSPQAAAIDAGRGLLYASAWLSTGYQTEEGDGLANDIPRPFSDGEVIVQLLDARGAELVRRSSPRRDTLNWTPWAAVIPLPPGTRGARYSWVAHHKLFYGPSNDASFDDLYLGYSESTEVHSTLSGNLLANPGAEDDQLGAAWESRGFRVAPDLRVLGLAVFPPWSTSGRGFFFGGGDLGISAGPADGARLAQRVDLSRYQDLVDSNQLRLRWGGSLRTWDARNAVKMRLEILQHDGTVWSHLDAPAVVAATWAPVEQLTRIPRGAAAVRLVIESDVDDANRGAFADELYVIAERAR